MATTPLYTRRPPRPGPIDRHGPVLEARGLAKTFGSGPRAVTAVDGLDLAVHAGEVVALLGPNGAGKTTTIKMAVGLVAPSSGQVHIAGADVSTQRGRAVAHVGAVLEGGRNVYWSLSAWQNLRYFGRLRGLRWRDLAPRAEWLLGELGLWERRHQQVGGYSRGMQQKVAIAAALVTDPALLLLDEPTIGLDVAAARTVKGWVRRLAAEDGKAVLLTTHQLDVAQELADRVAVIREGRIVADQPIEDLLARFQEDRHEVRVAAPAHALQVPLPADVELVGDDGDHTRLLVADQDPLVLHALLSHLAVLEIPLVSVTPRRPSLEDVFLRMVGDGSR
jgi:ABC-2 type transport system ATP-binding protein